jgi:hypothetical protein
MKAFVRVISIIFCAVILFGGGYLSYKLTDFDEIKEEFQKVVEAPWIADTKDNAEQQSPESSN